MGGDGEKPHARLDRLFKVELVRFEREFAGLDLGEVENVVDDAQQAVAGLQGRFHVPVVLARKPRLAEQAQHADHPVQRRADFMAHIGQELGLGAVGRLRAVQGEGQIGGPRGHLAFQLLAVVGQLAVRAFHAVQHDIESLAQLGELVAAGHVGARGIVAGDGDALHRGEQRMHGPGHDPLQGVRDREGQHNHHERGDDGDDGGSADHSFDFPRAFDEMDLSQLLPLRGHLRNVLKMPAGIGPEPRQGLQHGGGSSPGLSWSCSTAASSAWKEAKSLPPVS